MLWEDIYKKYPEQWVGLKNIVYKPGGKFLIATADVYLTGLPYQEINKRQCHEGDFEIAFTHTEAFWDGTLKENGIRLTVEEIQQKYTKEWVVIAYPEFMSDIDYDVTSGIPLYELNNHGEAADMQLFAGGVICDVQAHPGCDIGDIMNGVIVPCLY